MRILKNRESEMVIGLRWSGPVFVLWLLGVWGLVGWLILYGGGEASTSAKLIGISLVFGLPFTAIGVYAHGAFRTKITFSPTSQDMTVSRQLLWFWHPRHFSKREAGDVSVQSARRSSSDASGQSSSWTDYQVQISTRSGSKVTVLEVGQNQSLAIDIADKIRAWSAMGS